MKTMNKILMVFVLLLSSSMVWAINFPVYHSTDGNSYQSSNRIESSISSAQVSQTYRPSLNSDGSVSTPPGYSAAPRRAGIGGSGCSENGGGAHDFGENGVCTDCGYVCTHVGCVAGQECPTCHNTVKEHAGTPGEPTGNPLPIGSIMILLLFALMHVAFIAYTNSAQKQK